MFKGCLSKYISRDIKSHERDSQQSYKVSSNMFKIITFYFETSYIIHDYDTCGPFGIPAKEGQVNRSTSLANNTIQTKLGIMGVSSSRFVI